MTEEKWTDLLKDSCSNHYNLKIESVSVNSYYSITNFSVCAFDVDDEALVVVDCNGIAYYIDLSKTPAYKKLGCVGLSSCLAFNPNDKNELLIGLNSTNIKILKINNINDFCSLTGHTEPIKNISFYKDYCLTSSDKEVIVWNNKSYCKAHQLRLNIKSTIIKKAIFSNLGLIAILYQNDIIQSWLFKQFNKDNKIDVKKYGLKNIKDFDFTKDGRAMVVCGLQSKILVFNTTRFDLLKTIDLQNFSGGKQISVIPLPLDGGANSIVATLATNCSLKFISLTASNIIESCCDLQTGIKKIVVSHKGHYLAYISKNGYLNITFLNKVLNLHFDTTPKKIKKKKKLHCNKVDNHLKNVRNSIKEELKLQRLLPILREFGEYPQKYRTLIWATIMELPNNRKAYINLSNKVPHQMMSEMLKQDFLIDKSRNNVWCATMNCLLYWCPVFQECSFLPKLVIPFINVFQNTPVLGFEASVFVLLNYCQKWFEYHPLPPLNILGIIENILLEADPILFNHFCEKGITSTDYAWTLLHTTLSEVLSINDWLIMWDHLFSTRKPWLLLMCTVAYNILYRKTIITKLHSLDDYQQFYRTPGHASVKNILKIAHKLDCNIPQRVHPCQYLQKDISVIPNDGPYPPFFQFEFPKYLTDELRGINLQKFKEKEKLLRGIQLNAMENLEEKRLNEENDNFLKYVQKMRLNEIRKCYENKVQTDEKLLEYTKRQVGDLHSSKNVYDIIGNNSIFNDQNIINTTDNKKNQTKSKHKKCRLLQEQVNRLELEVQNLLTTLYNKSSSNKYGLK